MKPLIKWPGGKSREYKNIKDIIPSDMDKYIEPFFGGGGIYFNLEPRKAIINDINENLMSLYTLLKTKDGKFKELITHIANDWDNLSLIAQKVHEDTKKYKNNISKDKIIDEIDKLSKDKSLPKLINGQEHYWDLLKDGLIDKLNRIVSLEIKNGKFSDKDFYDQIVAVTKGAYYYYIRDKYVPKNKTEETAQFFYLREYCFGSMFRFNKDGKFNIPYGGASYNSKSFHTKIDKSLSPAVNQLLQGTEIYCEDFKTFFNKINNQISWNDFSFFDPPYDTEFSEYDKQPFGKKDQEELAEVFGKLKCKGLMIIKKTDFIYEIYKNQQKANPKIQINEYGKNYSYNVRGRNEREVTHLLITNYDFDLVKHNVQLSL
jgi:DNA adenine methylase